MKVDDKELKNIDVKHKNIKNFPVFLIIGIIVISIIIIGISYAFMRYAPVLIIEERGYAIQGKEIARSLKTYNFEKALQTIELLPVEEQTTLYKKQKNYYLEGDKNKSINIEYPIFINENIAILNICETMNLITDSYEQVDGYPNFTITNGKMYNQKDLTRADSNEYIFLKNSDNIYTNVREIKVKTIINEYTIPINSSINFTEEYISYYEIKDSYLQYKVIKEIDKNSIIIVNGIENTYDYLLKKLKIISDVEEVKIAETAENIIQTEEVPEENVEIPEKIKYIEPEVSCTNIISSVYTAKTELIIKDPLGTIQKGIEFTIETNGKTFQRRQALSNGVITFAGLTPNTKFKIYAEYTYKNEEGKKLIKRFFEDEFTTKDLHSLEKIKFKYENGDIYSNKIELKNFKIENNTTDEVFNGISKIEINVKGTKYKLSNLETKELLEGKEIKYQTTESVKSDSKISYEIFVYDKFGNQLEVENNKGNTYTAKMAPKVTITPEKQETTEVTLEIKLNNQDNVKIDNYHYTIFNSDGTKQLDKVLEKSDKKITLKNMDPNQVFLIQIYCNYDLGDIQGKQEEVLIGETKFTTLPISSLGYVLLKNRNEEINVDSNKIGLEIDCEKTDSRLIEILNSIKIVIKKDENYILEKDLTQEEIRILQEGQNYQVQFDNLDANTTYNIEIIITAKQGLTEEIIGVSYPVHEFTTLKNSAKIQVKNQFVTGNMIDFDVKIEDRDGAVLNNIIRMEMRDERERLIFLEEIQTNKDYLRKTYTNLDENKQYKILFYADQYNQGNTDSTYQSNKLLETIEIFTEEGISGNIGLTELRKTEVGKNLVDVTSETKWYVYPNFNTSAYYGKQYNSETETLNLGGNSNQRRCVYELKDYANQTVTISFSAKLMGNAGRGIYIQNAKTDKNRTKITGLNTTTWTNCVYTVVVDPSGYLGFYIDGGDGVQIKNLQIELGNKRTSYEKFQYGLVAKMSINLEDKRNEITTNDYYVKIYKNGNLVNSERYEEIGQNNIIENMIKKYTVDEDCTYTVNLVIKVKDREYVLNTQQFETKDGQEIKGIYNIQDFLEIQPNGNYIVLADLDFGNSSYYFGYAHDNRLEFNGTIDFNGHTVSKNATIRLFTRIGKNGILKNIVLDINLNNTVEIEFFGFFYYNYGTIENVQLNLVGSTNVPNTTIGLLGYVNMGTGVISNFAINLQAPLYCSRNASAFVYSNYGTIKNGYAYGENIKAIHNIPDNANKNIGIICMIQYYDAMLENIYSLVNVDVGDEELIVKNLGNVLCSNKHNATAKNIYSVGKGDSYDVRYGPTVASSGNNRIQNIYYFTDVIFKNTINQKTTKLALKDETFQNQILNSENAFNIDLMISMGYYPQVNMTDVMPRQEYIKLPETSDDDLADILSTEVLEQGTDTVKVKFMVNNPSGEIITNINIQSINTRIESQNYEEGKSTVIATLYDPVRYISDYNVLGITTKGAYNMPYTREFKENERVIHVDLFREINSIEDWKNINKLPTENYMLMTDLDFMDAGTTIIISKTFSGKLNGGNHTIKNIFVDGRSGLFAYLNKATIENLFIKNLNMRQINATYAGLVAYCANSKLNNIHITDVDANVLPTRISATYVGGLSGYIYSGTDVQNCSVTNFNCIATSKIVDIRIGAIIGTAYLSNVKNSFSTNISINVNNILASVGLGGIIGNTDYAYIENCYSTGEINADIRNIGGITGRTVGTCTIENCYSMVNIKSSEEYIGGIKGYGDNVPLNCLAIGNIYTKQKTSNICRISGYSISKNNNYAYNKQLINGYLEDEPYDANSLLSQEQILDISTYIDVLRWDGIYNFDELENGILPKLYNTSGTELLPNQQDSIIKIDNNIEIADVSYDKTDGENSITVRVEINNLNENIINNIQIEDMNVQIIRNITQDGKTYIDLTGTPTRYYDSYMINKIIYVENGIEKEKQVEAKINIQFYKEIYDFRGWQSIEENTYQNYRIMNDIDFSGKENIKTNITMARLEAEGESKTLKNITLNGLNGGQGFIEKISVNLENINFENVEITTSKSGNYMGIIRKTMCTINNIKFSNVTIDAKKMSYVGCIADNASLTRDITNIELQEIQCYGISYVGGFVGIGATANNIIANDINIQATGTYSGGIIGQCNNSINASNATLTDINVQGVNYVGGYSGYGYSILTATANNIIVNGNQYVGGLYGQMLSNGSSAIGYGKVNTIEDSNISGKGAYIGGIAGSSGDYPSGLRIVKRCEILGNTTSANYVGGIYGYAPGYNMSGNQVLDTKVISLGNYVGGIFGYSYSYNSRNCSGNVVENTIVEGKSNVGGMIGMQCGQRLYYGYCNAQVKATNSNAGGLVGYLRNEEMTAIFNSSGIVQTSVVGTTVTAPVNAGGLIGKIDMELYLPDLYFKNILVEAHVSASDENTMSIFIGSHKQNNPQLIKAYAYKYSTLNGEYISSQNDNIDESKLLTAKELSLKTTYTNIIGLSSYQNFAQLVNGKYPTIAYSAYGGTLEQRGINLPVDPENILPTNLLKTSLRLASPLYAKSNFLISLEEYTEEQLPTIEAYAISENEINIDFSKVEDGTYFTYVTGADIKKVYITQKTYTFKYDFNTDIELTIGKNNVTKTVNISPSKVRRNLSIVDNKYAYLQWGKLIINNSTREGEYVNLYNGKALHQDGSTYNIATGEVIERDITVFEMENAKSKVSYSYKGNEIQTYGTYSIVNGNYKSQIYIVKNHRLSIINSSAKIGQEIIDYYNEKEIQTILETDNKLYNLKSSIKYPENFENENILEIAVNTDENKKEIIVMYRNGKVLAFNYMTGEEIYTNMAQEDEGISQYILSKINNSDGLKQSEEYEKSILLQEKLEKTPLENIKINENSYNSNGIEIIDNSSISRKNSNNYITVFNNQTNKYEVYKEEELLKTENTSIESESSKIEKEPLLAEYYLKDNKKKFDLKENQGVIWFTLSISTIVIILGILYKHNKKLKRKR